MIDDMLWNSEYSEIHATQAKLSIIIGSLESSHTWVSYSNPSSKNYSYVTRIVPGSRVNCLAHESICYHMNNFPVIGENAFTRISHENRIPVKRKKVMFL